MFKSIITSIAEVTGQVVGEVVHQTSEVAVALTEIPSAIMKGYDEELFSSNSNEQSSTEQELTPDQLRIQELEALLTNQQSAA